MAYSSGGTAHMPPVHHFSASSYAYSKPSIQQQAWPPPYYHAHSYQPANAFQSPSNHKIEPPNRRPTPSTPSIQPDPLPPHSNPAQLSPSQSRAFQGPMPTAPVRLGKNDVLNPQSNTPILAISKEAVHMPSVLSSKPLLTLRRCATNTQLGTIRFHSMTTSSIDLQVNGRASVLSSSGLLHTRWSFLPTSTSSAASLKSGLWYWQRDKSLKGSIVLTDAKKHGNVIARMQKDVLSFEKVGLSPETLDEIVLTAVALSEHVRRNKGSSAAAADVLDIAGILADGGGSGSDGGGGGGDGGGGGGSC